MVTAMPRDSQIKSRALAGLRIGFHDAKIYRLGIFPHGRFNT